QSKKDRAQHIKKKKKKLFRAIKKKEKKKKKKYFRHKRLSLKLGSHRSYTIQKTYLQSQFTEVYMVRMPLAKFLYEFFAMKHSKPGSFGGSPTELSKDQSRSRIISASPSFRFS
ncbi:hypothetical protein IscW_ISCW023267, partial [Ixodes scapularis]